MAIASVNGRISAPENATVSVFDRGFLFGDGVYETGRSYGRTFIFLEEHFTRLRKSAGKLAIPTPWSDNDLKDGLYALAREYGQSDVYFRTIVTRGPIPSVGLEILDDPKPTLVHVIQNISMPKIEKQRSQGIKLLTSKILRNSAAAQDPNIKTSNYLNSLLALQDVKARGADDAILCNADGIVTEGTTFSVFGARGNELITADLNVGILDSITRRHVIEAAGPELKVKEGSFSLAEFLACDEAFIASSVREVVPIRQWDGKTFAAMPGKIATLVHQKLQAHIKEYLATHTGY